MFINIKLLTIRRTPEEPFSLELCTHVLSILVNKKCLCASVVCVRVLDYNVHTRARVCVCSGDLHATRCFTVCEIELDTLRNLTPCRPEHFSSSPVCGVSGCFCLFSWSSVSLCSLLLSLRRVLVLSLLLLHPLLLLLVLLHPSPSSSSFSHTPTRHQRGSEQL